MATSLQIYESQVIQFLKSCTIIFSQIATLQNTNLINSGYAVLDDPTTWKYYLNLSGQYHPTDTVMYVQSLDTKQSIEFSPASLAANPKTLAGYSIGSSYHTNLCQQYPTQVDLIKSILYPVDMETAINSPDFTLLKWGEGYLETDEEEAIINEIVSFLSYAVTSWYFTFLENECYYVWTFWASLWQTLPNVIFAARLKYLHTSYVHSFHIWSSLTSKGIGDYSDILTRQQSLFLYRNIDYLIQNRGTQKNLVILVNNLLNSLNVGLVGKTIYMNTATRAATCQWTPEFVSTIVPTNDAQSLVIIPPESMTQMNGELYNAGLEVDTTLPWIDKQQTYIGDTTLNILPTKMLEIQKLGVDQKYGLMLINFLMDTWVSMVVNDRYTADLSIVDPTTNIPITLGPKDTLALYYYAVMYAERNTSQGIITPPTVQEKIEYFLSNYPYSHTPEVMAMLEQMFSIGPQDGLPFSLPTIYTPSSAFRYDIAEAVIPKTFNFNGYTYVVSNFLSIPGMIEGTAYPTSPVTDPDDFSTVVSNLFSRLVDYVRFSRTNADRVTQEILQSYTQKYFLQTIPYTYSLSADTEYTVWADHLGLTPLFEALDNSAKPQDAWNQLATAITAAMIPWNTTILNYFGFTPDSVISVYNRIKELFVQLCSYNVAFLNTNFGDNWWFFSNPIVYEVVRSIPPPSGLTVQQKIEFFLLNRPYLHTTDQFAMLEQYTETNLADIVTIPCEELLDVAMISSTTTST